MPARRPEADLISWADVQQAWRWFEAGYGLKIVLVERCACPVGEQHNKLYLDARLEDDAGNAVPLPQRVATSFPSSRHQTLAGAKLQLLYKLDEVLGKSRVWAEPTIAVEPRRGRPRRT